MCYYDYLALITSKLIDICIYLLCINGFILDKRNLNNTEKNDKLIKVSVIL